MGILADLQGRGWRRRKHHGNEQRLHLTILPLPKNLSNSLRSSAWERTPQRLGRLLTRTLKFLEGRTSADGAGDGTEELDFIESLLTDMLDVIGVRPILIQHQALRPFYPENELVLDVQLFVI